VTYEGTIPGFDGLSATISTVDEYGSLVLSQPQGHFCGKGVEDWAVGGARASAITNALAVSNRPIHPERLDRRMVDYVQLNEDLLDPSDPYWEESDLPAPNACWDGVAPGQPRYDICFGAFGAAADQGANRDLPILEAYDDHLVVSRFATIPPNKTRELVYKDPSNAQQLKLARCCFHHQVKFNIRTGSEWSAVGSTIGFLSHLTRGDGGRCIPSCEARESLLNARAPSLPFGPGDFAPHRDSVLALRNPSFSYFVQNGQKNGADVVPQRDSSWHFQSRGQFTSLTVNLAATTTTVDPQSMRFIDALGQLAVIDAASQGLVLIDLSTVALARAPFF
jgi:hypothetical protein